jgi:hypothetical protein
VLFHFQYRCEDRWEDMGSGEGAGIGSAEAALADLNGLSGGVLPVGFYRCIAASGGSAYWEHLLIDADGAIGFADDDLIEEEAGAPAEWLRPRAPSPHLV